MEKKIYNVLFLCTGNSARSILAEGIMNKLGAGKFKAYSAGSFPKGEVNPLAIATLKEHGHDISGLRSKSWDEFAVPNAPKMDFVFTVCDQAAGEPCPLWPGKPIAAHWGFTDPSFVEGGDAEKRAAFAKTYQAITQRLKLFLSLPIEKLDKTALQNQLRDIAKSK
jgi:arsenate reductase